MEEINGFAPAAKYDSTRPHEFPLLKETKSPPETPPAQTRLMSDRSG